MQILHRSGEDRASDAADQAGFATPFRTPPSAGVADADTADTVILDQDLEIHASHITAAAMAAAAVTAAVATMLAEPAPADAGEDDRAGPRPPASSYFRVVPETASAYSLNSLAAHADGALAEPMSQTGRTVASPVLAKLREDFPVSLLTFVVTAFALWWSSQWPWPVHALKPVVPTATLAALIQPDFPAATDDLGAAAATEVADAPVLTPAQIDTAQLEAEEKARQLAQQFERRQAATEARHRRERAALAAREKRRRQAQAQLDEARARAELAQRQVPAAVPVLPEAPVAPSLADQLNQCQSLSLLARESCLWKLCGGKWGQNGCPSYSHTHDGA